MGTYGRMARCNPNPLHIIRSFALGRLRTIVFKRDQKEKKTGFALGAESRISLTMPPPFHGNRLFFAFLFISGLVSCLARSLISAIYFSRTPFFFSHMLTRRYTHAPIQSESADGAPPYGPQESIFELHARGRNPISHAHATTYCPFQPLVEKRQSCSAGTDN